jgi:hypothetical protein
MTLQDLPIGYLHLHLLNTLWCALENVNKSLVDESVSAARVHQNQSFPSLHHTFHRESAGTL